MNTARIRPFRRDDGLAAPAAPTVSTVQITGLTEVGEVLQVRATLIGNPFPDVVITWLDENDAVLQTGTSQFYTIRPEVQGLSIKATVEATNAQGVASGTSPLVGPVTAARAVIPTLYVNSNLAGGAPSGPALGANAPTAHGLGSNTLNSAPAYSGEGWFGWEINPEAATGSSFLTYDLAANNPGLIVGNMLQLTYVVGKVSGADDVVLGYETNGSVSVTEVRTTAMDGQDVNVSLYLTIEAVPYAFVSRVGAGISTDNDGYMFVSKPKLTLFTTPPVLEGIPTVTGITLVGRTVVATPAEAVGQTTYVRRPSNEGDEP